MALRVDLLSFSLFVALSWNVGLVRGFADDGRLQIRNQVIWQNATGLASSILSSSSTLRSLLPIPSNTEPLTSDIHFLSTQSQNTYLQKTGVKADTIAIKSDQSLSSSSQLPRPASTTDGVFTFLKAPSLQSKSGQFSDFKSSYASISSTSSPSQVSYGLSRVTPSYSGPTFVYDASSMRSYLPSLNLTEPTSHPTGFRPARPTGYQGTSNSLCSGIKTFNPFVKTYMVTITEIVGTITIAPGDPTPSPIYISPLPPCSMVNKTRSRQGPGVPTTKPGLGLGLGIGEQTANIIPLQGSTSTLQVTKKTLEISYTPKTVGPLFQAPVTPPPAQPITQPVPETERHRTDAPAVPTRSSQSHSEPQHSDPIIISPQGQVGELPGSVPGTQNPSGSGTSSDLSGSTHNDNIGSDGGAPTNEDGQVSSQVSSGPGDAQTNEGGQGSNQDSSGSDTSSDLTDSTHNDDIEFGGDAQTNEGGPSSSQNSFESSTSSDLSASTHNENTESGGDAQSNEGGQGSSQDSHGSIEASHGSYDEVSNSVDENPGSTNGHNPAESNGKGDPPAIIWTPDITTVNNVPVSISPNGVVVGVHTIPRGAGPTMVTVNGQSFTIEPSRIVAAGTTLPLPIAHHQPATSLKAGNIPIILRPNNAVIASKTYDVEISPTTIVHNGETFVLGPSKLVATHTTVNLPDASSDPAIVTAGGEAFSVFPGQLEAPGITVAIPRNPQPSQFVHRGQTFTVNPSQLIVPHKTFSLPSSITPAPLAITADGVVISLGPSAAIMGSQTYSLTPGQTPTSIVFEGQTISLGPQGLGLSRTTIAIPSAQPTFSVYQKDGITFSLAASVAVVGGHTYTLSSGMTPLTTVINGQAVTVSANGVALPGTTFPNPSPTPTFSVYQKDDITFSLAASVAVVGGHTYTLSPGMTPLTTVINGQAVTVSANGVALPGTTFPIPTPTATFSVATKGSLTFSVNPTEAVIQGHTYLLTPGATPITTTINGQGVVIGSDGVAFAGTTAPLPQPTQGPDITTVNGLTFSLGTSQVVISGTTYAVGYGAKPTTVTVGAESISIGPGGIGFSDTTVVPSATQGPGITTVNGLTFSLGPSQVVLSGTTYAVGYGAKPTTVSVGAESISIGPGGIGLSDTTIVPSATTTDGPYRSDVTPLPATPSVTLQPNLKNNELPSAVRLLPNRSLNPFMQPEPTQVTQRSSSPHRSPDESTTSHHGLQQRDHRALGSSHCVEHEGEHGRPALRDKTAAVHTAGSPPSTDNSIARLRSVSPPQPRSPGERIAEHERASTYSTKKRNEGPGFTVIHRGKKSGTGQCTITDFPNEVLTHILSHLPPPSFSDVSLVSRRFHSLVTTPHAWRMAFSRFFPGAESITPSDTVSEISDSHSEKLRSETRTFARLTAIASWRSEYILRTRLLRSLARGRPAEIQCSGGISRSGSGQSGNAQTTYDVNLITPISHINATFGASLGKKSPTFIHGTDEMGLACISDPRLGKVEPWGFSDPQGFSQFVDRFPGDAQYGLGSGEVIGVPNPMDVSQSAGMIYGEGWPGGVAYYRSVEEKRGRVLVAPTDVGSAYVGAPSLPDLESICTVWIAKNPSIPRISEGLVGVLTGSSQGVISAYSLGTNSLRERRLERGELTARWVLSPGVPIIATVVDEDFSAKRRAQNRIWAVALNALGEAFYLIKFPTRSESLSRSTKLSPEQWEVLAWQTGRTVFWDLIEPTRRTARPDPFNESEIDGSYSPRTSSIGMGLSREQVAAETKEIEQFVRHTPKYFRTVCEGWDMQRRLEVDYAASDEDAAGEGILVLDCGLRSGVPAVIKRYTRCKTREPSKNAPQFRDSNQASVDTGDVKEGSLFGGIPLKDPQVSAWSFDMIDKTRRSSVAQSDISATSNVVEEWLISVFSLGALKSAQLTTSTLDKSTFASLTTFEDPIISMAGSSAATSPTMSPLGQTTLATSSAGTPGHRARLMAAGTKTGSIIVWDIRASTSSNRVLDNVIKPVRIIHTDSPQISCLGLSALYLVHGGNDGLVQAWDPLASTSDPIRTLNSRFSSRARRRLVQAEASPQGVGINLFAAGAICLDPDPTSLRGIVSLGTHLRYWSYSSSAADQYKTNKRRLRRSGRGSNPNSEHFSGTGRGALKEYIANEKAELEVEKEKRRKEEERLAGRFGLDLLGPGATEDEILAYATLLSEEASAHDELRRKSASGSDCSQTIEEGSLAESAYASELQADDEEDDENIREAIRLSLQENSGPDLSVTDRSQTPFSIKYAKAKRSPSSSPKARKLHDLPAEVDDLTFALSLSLAEEKSRREAGCDEYEGKGKGRAQ